MGAMSQLAAQRSHALQAILAASSLDQRRANDDAFSNAGDCGCLFAVGNAEADSQGQVSVAAHARHKFGQVRRQLSTCAGDAGDADQIDKAGAVRRYVADARVGASKKIVARPA